MKDYIIIGAGLSGLATAKSITEFGLGSALVLEKSKGVGGRMATRRTLATRFDHGAQFYRLKNDINEFHQLWNKNELSHQWFVSPIGNHWCAREGMTTLAKVLAQRQEVQLEKQIESIHFENNTWTIISDKNEKWECHNLILTAPLPQSILLLEKNGIEISAELKNITYSKALIALVTLKDTLAFSPHGYVEYIEGDFFSITDQVAKGVSTIPALTITMSAEFSEKEFENINEAEVLAKIIKKFLVKYPTAEIIGSELKKWRYCKPSSTYSNPFAQVSPKLFLIGDAFGGSSLIGAIRSSKALCEHLINNLT
ncbi:MAG: FAD-dependent oxidoreductase [Bacteriovorax sp.]|nr:FAD-dependent oxidoreductase [Bacteriovorax sp.]